jgi:hypothetical protein
VGNNGKNPNQGKRDNKISPNNLQNQAMKMKNNSVNGNNLGKF